MARRCSWVNRVAPLFLILACGSAWILRRYACGLVSAARLKSFGKLAAVENRFLRDCIYWQVAHLERSRGAEWIRCHTNH